MKKRLVIKLGTGVLSTPAGKSLDAAQFTYAGGQAVKRFVYAAKQHHSLQMAS